MIIFDFTKYFSILTLICFHNADSISLPELPRMPQYAPSVGKICQLKAGESFSSDSKVVAPSSTSHNEITGTDEIILQSHMLGVMVK